MKRALPYLIIAAVFVAAVGWGAWLHHRAKPRTGPAVVTAEPDQAALPRGGSDVVTIELYGDYQCPPCGDLHPILKALKREYGEKMNLVFYHLPLVDIHPHALEAALAVTAAERQGKFTEMHDLMYESQAMWAGASEFRPIALRFARQLGLDVERFAKDLDDPGVREVVAIDQRRAAARGIQSTPTVFVDGRPIDYDDPTEPVLRREIERSLAGPSPSGKR